MSEILTGAWRALREGAAEEPFAPTARDWRWWLRAVRRRPWLAVTGVGGFAVVQALNGFLPPAQGFSVGRTLVHGGAVGLAVFLLKSVHVLTRHAAETDDVRREQLARRRPVDALATEPSRPDWSWQGPRARQSLRWSLAWTALAASLGLSIVTDPWGWEAGGADRVAWLAGVLLTFIAPLTAAVTLPLLAARRARALLTRRLRPVPLRLLGVGRISQAWYAVRLDREDDERLMLAPFPGRSLLVAGDTLHAWTAAPPPRSPGRSGEHDVAVALTGPTGTLWARLGYASVLMPAPEEHP